MRTLEDEIGTAIEVDLAVMPQHQRRAACDRDRQKAESARKEMARIISAALLARYHFEPLKHASASCHPNWEQAFEQQFGAGRGGDRHE
ncbi:hypothetical protein GOD93_11070 [Sinorhizobium medicae]|nr:hypothetical protein [Sinorhizobium medicae]